MKCLTIFPHLSGIFTRGALRGRIHHDDIDVDTDDDTDDDIDVDTDDDNDDSSELLDELPDDWRKSCQNVSEELIPELLNKNAGALAFDGGETEDDDGICARETLCLLPITSFLLILMTRIMMAIPREMLVVNRSCEDILWKENALWRAY